MPIRVIVEFQAKPGARGELASALDEIMATIGPGIPGFMGSTLYEVLDNPDARSRLPSGTLRIHRRLPWNRRWHQGCTAVSSSSWRRR